MPTTLYHGRTSVCSVKARLALAEKSVTFDSKLLTLRGDQYDPDYLKLNPNAVVPTLVHDGHVVVESTIIMHYVDEAFPGPELVPADAVGRARMRLIEKMIDEYVHVSCMTLTFATANRPHLMNLSPQEMDEELAKAPDQKRSEIKRQVVTHGLDAPLVKDALRHHDRLFDMMETALKSGPYLAGSKWSLADAAATPYIWRLEKLKLARLWDRCAEITRWYHRVRERPSFKTAVEDWVSAEDNTRYASQPDPWPKVSALIRAA